MLSVFAPDRTTCESRPVPIKRLQPGTPFLLLGVPAARAAAVVQGLQQAGAGVDVAGLDARGYRLVRRERYDAILLALAGRGGGPDLAAVRYCRRHDPGAGILAILPGRDVAQLVHVLDGGADDGVGAPAHPDELLARLAALARRSRRRRPSGPVLRAHDLEVDTHARAVRRAGQAIELAPREYALLCLLMVHRGEVLRRDRIRQHLYGDSRVKSSNIIDVYVRYLRNKIDRGFDPPLILTRWGEGYLLRGDD